MITTIECPLCMFRVHLTRDEDSLETATERIMDHCLAEHPEAKIVSPGPGKVIAQLDERLFMDDLSSGRLSDRFISLSLTCSATKETQAVAYNLLGATGHDLLMAGYDFSISRNEVDMNDPLPPYDKGGEYLHYDSDTMAKVRVCIDDAITAGISGGLTASRLRDAIIDALQNADVVFRERS